jgi:hypothetical protein
LQQPSKGPDREALLSFLKGSDHYRCEWFGGDGTRCELALFKTGRRAKTWVFDTRPQAIRWVSAERQAIELGWVPWQRRSPCSTAGDAGRSCFSSSDGGRYQLAIFWPLASRGMPTCR